jgi:hypothetical protein
MFPSNKLHSSFDKQKFRSVVFTSVILFWHFRQSDSEIFNF